MSEIAAENRLSTRGREPFKFDWVTWLLLAVLAMFVAGAFAPAVRAGFVELDDETYVFGNPQVLGGLSLHAVKWALTTRAGGFYIPMTWLSLELDATISNMLHGGTATGIPATGNNQLPDARVYHVTNIILHVAASWILFLFLWRATHLRWASFVVVLLWAVHPLRVESVAWVTERKDEIAGVFGFLAMYFYVVAIEKKGRAKGIWFWLACGLMVLSLWGKAMFVTMPALLVVVDFWPLGRMKSFRDFGRAVLEKWPMWVIAIVGAIVTAHTSHGNGTLDISQWEKMENGFLSYVRYLDLQLDFGKLAPLYPYVGSPVIQVCGALGIFVVATAAVIWLRKRWPWLLAGWAWYVMAFLPMIGFVQTSSQAYADRFSYLPSVGVIAIVVFTLFHLRRATGVIVAGAFAAAVILAGFSFRQTSYWRNSITLFERAREVTPANSVLFLALGRGYMRVGRLDDAEQEFQGLMKIMPSNMEGHMLLASVYVQTQRPELGEAEAKAATELAPDKSGTHKLYGSILFLNQRYFEANVEFERALQIDPDDEDMRKEAQLAREKAVGAGG